MRELAITAPVSIALEKRGSVEAADSRVRNVKHRVRHAAVLFLQVGLEVVAETVIQRKLPSQLPSVLGIEPKGVVAQLGLDRRINIQIVNLT